MKKVLFWTTCILTVPTFLIVEMLMVVGEFILTLLHDFEGWAFDYEKDGWENRGDGIWINNWTDHNE